MSEPTWKHYLTDYNEGLGLVYERFVLNDSLRDLQAAATVGAQPLLVKTGKGFGTASHPDLPVGIPVYDDLYSAVDALLSN